MFLCVQGALVSMEERLNHSDHKSGIFNVLDHLGRNIAAHVWRFVMRNKHSARLIQRVADQKVMGGDILKASIIIRVGSLHRSPQMQKKHRSGKVYNNVSQWEKLQLPSISLYRRSPFLAVHTVLPVPHPLHPYLFSPLTLIEFYIMRFCEFCCLRLECQSKTDWYLASRRSRFF